MTQDPFLALSFITGPAILTNACSVLQSGATTRYNLAITQWREFRASLAADDDRLSLLYVDAERALSLAGRRIRLQLLALALLNAGIALFAASAVLGLIAAALRPVLLIHADAVTPVVTVAVTTALAALLAAIGALFFEGACGREMLRLHPSASPHRPQGLPAQAAVSDEIA